MSATAAIHAASAINLETYLLLERGRMGFAATYSLERSLAGPPALTAGIRLARLG
jgi:hypothetical protein